jgi:hypothetical protein
MLDSLIKLILGGLIYKKAKELHDDPEYQDLRKKVDKFQNELEKQAAIRNQNPLHGIEFLEIIIPSSGERLQVAPKDFGEEMDWDEATEACKKLGNRWRLPTIEELKTIYKELYMKNLGFFKKEIYWSSTEVDIHGGAFFFAFDDGDEYESNDTSFKYYVRPVREFRFQKQFPMEAMSQKPALGFSIRKPLKSNRYISDWD